MQRLFGLFDVLFLAGVILLCPGVRAAALVADSVSFTDVSNAVARASIGDTVLVPEGRAVWNSTLLITTPIVLSGAGPDRTVIVATNGPALRFKPAVTSFLRLTRMAFVATMSNYVVLIGGKGSGGVVIDAFRVDHCHFTGGLRAVCPRGWAYGVIDHCTFVNCNIAVGPIGDDSAAWQRPIEPGSTNAVYIEDNLFLLNNDAPREPNEQIYHQQGARSVTRFNTFDGTQLTKYNSMFFDSHGNWPAVSPSTPDDPMALAYRGQPIIEIYGNTFSAHHTYRFIHLRGGSVLAYSNILTTVSGSATAFHLSEEEAWSTSFWSPLRTNWPAHDQITNSFFWANTLNGNPIQGVYANEASRIFIQEGRDFWLEPPSASNGLPQGIYASYRPLMYPHPLTIERQKASNKPFPPSSLRISYVDR